MQTSKLAHERIPKEPNGTGVSDLWIRQLNSFVGGPPRALNVRDSFVGDKTKRPVGIDCLMSLPKLRPDAKGFAL